jgi:hypothetical protein
LGYIARLCLKKKKKKAVLDQSKTRKKERGKEGRRKTHTVLVCLEFVVE